MNITKNLENAITTLNTTLPYAEQINNWTPAVHCAKKVAKVVTAHPELAAAGEAVIAAANVIIEANNAAKAAKAARAAERANKAAAVTAAKASTSVATLAAALKDHRDAYKAGVAEKFARNVEYLLGKVEAAGGDLRKAFPKANYSREESYQFSDACRLVNHVNGSVRLAVRKSSGELEAIIAGRAESATRDYFDGYVFKLSQKIGKEVYRATVTGDLWFGSILKVACVDGEEQTWRTKCILNVSVLGKVFNQFPTTRH